MKGSISTKSGVSLPFLLCHGEQEKPKKTVRNFSGSDAGCCWLNPRFPREINSFILQTGLKHQAFDTQQSFLESRIFLLLFTRT